MVQKLDIAVQKNKKRPFNICRTLLFFLGLLVFIQVIFALAFPISIVITILFILPAYYFHVQLFFKTLSYKKKLRHIELEKK